MHACHALWNSNTRDYWQVGLMLFFDLGFSPLLSKLWWFVDRIFVFLLLSGFLFLSVHFGTYNTCKEVYLCSELGLNVHNDELKWTLKTSSLFSWRRAFKILFLQNLINIALTFVRYPWTNDCFINHPQS